MSKRQVDHLVNGDYEPYQCECGNDKFSVVKEYSDYNIGTVEMELHCECGVEHSWAYGYAGKLNEGAGEE